MQNFSGLFNITGSGGLIAANQQNNHDAIPDGVVNTQASGKEETKFKEIFAKL